LFGALEPTLDGTLDARHASLPFSWFCNVFAALLAILTLENELVRMRKMLLFDSRILCASDFDKTQIHLGMVRSGLWVRVALLACLLIHVVVSPYSKVEESFNLQATHDIYNYGLNVSQYDHLEYPGVVPRTMVGALILATVSSPLLMVAPPGIHQVIGRCARLYSQVWNKKPSYQVPG
jgi:hypothetical protein